MKLLLDENLSWHHAAALRDDGYDAVAVMETGLSGASDEKVRKHAIETGRIVVTLDADFANLLRFPPRGTPGVIRLRIHPATEGAVRKQLKRTIHALREVNLNGCLAVAHGHVIRIRS